MGCGNSKASCLAIAPGADGPRQRQNAPGQLRPPDAQQGDQNLEALEAIPMTRCYEEDFVVGKLLGKGSFGKVYCAIPRTPDSEEIIAVDSNSAGDRDGSDSFKGRRRRVNESDIYNSSTAVAIKVMEVGKGVKATSIVREWRVLEHLKHHPACVRYYRTYRTPESVAFVFEVMRGGELFDRLIKFGPVGETESCVQIGRLMQGLAYFHGRGIIHRDIKPENLLLTHPYNEDRATIPLSQRLQEERWRVSDFGLSQLINKNERLLKVCGTWAYSAPQQYDPQRRGYDCRFDCFSMGVVTFVVLSGSHPFDPQGCLPVAEIKARAKNVVYDFSSEEWRCISMHAKDFIARLMRKDDAVRMTAAEACEHPWVSGISSPLMTTPRRLSVSSQSSGSSPELGRRSRQQQRDGRGAAAAGGSPGAGAIVPAGMDFVRVEAMSGSSAGARSSSPAMDNSVNAAYTATRPSYPQASATVTAAAVTALEVNAVTAGSSSAGVTPPHSPRAIAASGLPPSGQRGTGMPNGRTSSFLRRHDVNIASPISPDKALAQGLFTPPALSPSPSPALSPPLHLANPASPSRAGAIGIDLDGEEDGVGQLQSDEDPRVEGRSSSSAASGAVEYRYPIPKAAQTHAQRQPAPPSVLRPTTRDRNVSVAVASPAKDYRGLGEADAGGTPLTAFVTAVPATSAVVPAPSPAGAGRSSAIMTRHQVSSSHFIANRVLAGKENEQATGKVPAAAPAAMPFGGAGTGADEELRYQRRAFTKRPSDVGVASRSPRPGSATLSNLSAAASTATAVNRPPKSPPGGE